MAKSKTSGKPGKSEVEYVSKKDAMVKREPKAVIVERELDKLHKKHGTVSPQLMIDAAQDIKHALHKYFEWDDSVAAQKFRLNQAQAMIMATKYVLVLNSKAKDPVNEPLVLAAHRVQVRKFLPLARGAGQKTREEILSDEESRARTVEGKIAILKSWCRSVVDIGELDGLREAIERELEVITAKAAE